jgi:serine kinase of HPr protein (carbohydrate metabolism regulator)
MKTKTDNKNAATLHGSAVLLRSVSHPPAAVFLRGLSGSGKSDLAFRLIETGGVLISDDQVALEKRQEKLFAQPVDAIRGLLELRGVGLLRYPCEDKPSRIRLVIDLIRYEDVPRLPEWEAVNILGVDVPRLHLHAFEMSAARKVMKAMEIIHQPELIIK